MLYLAGDNSLSEDMVLALQRLQAEGAPEGDQIFAQFDPSGVGLATQRYHFDDTAGKSGHQPLDDFLVADVKFPETNTGSPATLRDFIAWARDECGDRRRGSATSSSFRGTAAGRPRTS